MQKLPNCALSSRPRAYGFVALALAVCLFAIGCGGTSHKSSGSSSALGSRSLADTRGGVSEIAEIRLEEIGFRELWSNPTGGPIVQAFCVSGNVYVVRPSSDHPFILEKLDGESGLSVWFHPLREKLEFSPFVYRYPREIRAANPDELFIVQEDELVGLDDRYGQKNFGSRLTFPVSTGPVADQDHVYLGSWNRRLYAINKRTQLEQWSYITDDSITAEATVGDANVYFGSEDNQLYCMTRGGGYVPGRSWRLKTGGRVTTSALVYGDRIFIGSGDYKLYCVEDVGSEALIRWAYASGAPIARDPFAFRDWVVTVTRESRPGGGVIWKAHALGAVRGELRWEAKGIVECLAADSIHLYALDTEGNVQALRLDSGQLDWTLETAGFDQVLGQDANLGADKAWWGRLFLVSHRGGVVQAIRPRR